MSNILYVGMYICFCSEFHFRQKEVPSHRLRILLALARHVWAFHSGQCSLLEYQTWNFYLLLFPTLARTTTDWNQTRMSKQNMENEKSISKYLSTRNNHFSVKLPLSNRWQWCEIALEPVRKGTLSLHTPSPASPCPGLAPVEAEAAGFTREFDQLNCHHVTFSRFISSVSGSCLA